MVKPTSKNRKLRDRSGSTKGRAPTVHGRYICSMECHMLQPWHVSKIEKGHMLPPWFFFLQGVVWYFFEICQAIKILPKTLSQNPRQKKAKCGQQMILGIISCTEVSTNHTEMVKANEDVSHHIDNINIYKSRIINGSIQDVCQQGSKKVWCDIQSKLRTVNKANSWCCLLLVPFWNILAYLCHGCNSSSRSLACQSFKQACDHLWHLFAVFFCLNWVSVLVASPHGEKTKPGK